MSGKNFNVGVYDNDLKGVGQDALSHLRQFRLMSGLSSGDLYSFAVGRALRPRTAKLRFGFSLSTRRQGGIPTIKVKPKVHKRRLTNNQYGI
ncbi:hypothetical protein CXF72_14370 [Psychromonas sp. MB-3u-54]|uniref:hypothetical protein n=1 Tax=Psychromonas sp. MB-3u-54 TaxID=2058319 RepID=UPI000C32F25E|nr:hypothetical protein [Psychromonas sp. MB-3u-54]PKH01866.1 hypothetical protein CXF72_14370 [Psychromonas sp. MB-3u-54]